MKAALFRGAGALRAWEEWKGSADPRRLDPGSQRLLPQLFRNLRAVGVRDPLLEGLRPVYQRTWAKNRVLFRDLAGLLSGFDAEGIPTLVLKGAALIPLAYKDYGSRPMTDIDVLVPGVQARAAIELLRKWGWTSSLELPQTLIGVRHADEFVDAAKRRLDLHWSVLQECCGPRANDGFWEARMPVTVEGVPTHALCPADQLLHVCVHGARWSPVQPVGWIADAMMILGSFGSQLQWDRLLAQTESRRLAVPMKAALRYLRTGLGADIPAETLERMQGIRTSRTERQEHTVKMRRRELVGTLPVLWFDYARLAGDAGFARKALGFPRYLQCTFRVRTLWGLPVAMLSLAAKRITHLNLGPITAIAGLVVAIRARH